MIRENPSNPRKSVFYLLFVHNPDYRYNSKSHKLFCPYCTCEIIMIKNITSVYFLWFFILGSVPAHGTNEMRRSFDMGTSDSPLKEGCTRITQDDMYSSDNGFGWIEKPASAFDRSKSRCKAAWYQKFWGMQVVGDRPWYGEPVDDLWRDGVSGKGDIAFRLDVPNGVYNVWATVGDEEWTRHDMNIEAEGRRRAIDTVRFPGLEAPHDFRPRTEPIALAGFISEGSEIIVICADPSNEVDEIYEGNNEVELTFDK